MSQTFQLLDIYLLLDKSRSNNDFDSVKVGILVNSLFDNFNSNNDGKPENDPGSITEILFWKCGLVVVRYADSEIQLSSGGLGRTRAD